MKRFKSLLLITAAALSLLCLFGCGKDSQVQEPFGTRSDYKNLDGYYIGMANEVKNDSDITIEENYFIYSDEQMTKVVGTMTVDFDNEGNLKQYEALIGVINIEKLISFSAGDDGSEYYTVVSFNSDGIMTGSDWENIIFNQESSAWILYKGKEKYYKNGSVKSFYEEQYSKDGETDRLIQKTEREYSETGELTVDKSESY